MANNTASDSVVSESCVGTSNGEDYVNLQSTSEETVSTDVNKDSVEITNSNYKSTHSNNANVKSIKSVKTGKNENILSYYPEDSEEVTVTNYNDLYDAISAGKKVITLGGDEQYIANQMITISSQVTINCNGKTITGASNLENVFVINENINVIINNLKFKQNVVSSGTILNKGSLNINYCEFTENSAISGTQLGGAINNNGYLNVFFCNFTNNVANQGGAIYCGVNGEILINNSKFINNHAFTGGALKFLNTGKDSKIENSEFESNYHVNNGGSYGDGSVLWIGASNKLYLNNISINKSYMENINQQAIICVKSGATLNINNSVINGTKSVYVIDNWGGNVELSNTNITNSALTTTSNNAAIIYNSNPGPIKLSYMNIDNNIARYIIFTAIVLDKKYLYYCD